MKIDRIQFSKIKNQWEILKMKSAYIEAEKAIINNPSLTGFQEQAALQVIQSTPEQEWDAFGIPKEMNFGMTQRQKLEAQIAEIEEVGRRLQAEEKYELMQEAKEIWEKLQKQLKNLK